MDRTKLEKTGKKQELINKDKAKDRENFRLRSYKMGWGWGKLRGIRELSNVDKIVDKHPGCVDN